MFKEPDSKLQNFRDLSFYKCLNANQRLFDIINNEIEMFIISNNLENKRKSLSTDMKVCTYGNKNYFQIHLTDTTTQNQVFSTNIYSFEILNNSIRITKENSDTMPEHLLNPEAFKLA